MHHRQSRQLRVWLTPPPHPGSNRSCRRPGPRAPASSCRVRTAAVDGVEGTGNGLETRLDEIAERAAFERASAHAREKGDERVSGMAVQVAESRAVPTSGDADIPADASATAGVILRSSIFVTVVTVCGRSVRVSSGEDLGKEALQGSGRAVNAAANAAARPRAWHGVIYGGCFFLEASISRKLNRHRHGTCNTAPLILQGKAWHRSYGFFFFSQDLDVEESKVPTCRHPSPSRITHFMQACTSLTTRSLILFLSASRIDAGPEITRAADHSSPQ